LSAREEVGRVLPIKSCVAIARAGGSKLQNNLCTKWLKEKGRVRFLDETTKIPGSVGKQDFAIDLVFFHRRLSPRPVLPMSTEGS
jgi:hypothetical protein